MHCSAIGKAYLSALDDDALEAQLRQLTFDAGTANAVRSAAELREHIAAARDRRYAIDSEETSVGVTCVASPVRVGNAPMGAVGISAPSGRLSGGLIDECGQYIASQFRSPIGRPT
jgi:DNA-binding IclR family transcriptional regulator